MATFTKLKLSGSTDGKGIKVTTTGTPGDQIHQAHASALDEIYLFVSNLDTAAVTLTIEFGGVTDPDHLICKALSIPANSPPIPVVAGLLLTNSLNVKAFASSANKLIISGFVNRIA
jgi:hypothetical protein